MSKYRGFTITVEKVTGWVYTIEDKDGNVLNDEENILHEEF